jgi:hypothetical protein
MAYVVPARDDDARREQHGQAGGKADTQDGRAPPGHAEPSGLAGGNGVQRVSSKVHPTP